MNIYDTANVIYKITNKVNGKIYFGLTSDTAHGRYIKHLSNSKKCKTGIDGAIGKYGKDNFILEVVDHTEDYGELNLKEQYYIAKYNAMDPNIGYNQTAGGGGTKDWHHTEEAAYRCGSSFRGKKRVKAPGQVEKWKKSYIGHKFSEEVRKARSEQLKLAYAEGRRVPNGKGVGGRGPMTPEEKFLNSENQKGKRTMHNDDMKVNMVVYKNEIDEFKNSGWNFKIVKEYETLSRTKGRELGLIK